MVASSTSTSTSSTPDGERSSALIVLPRHVVGGAVAICFRPHTWGPCAVPTCHPGVGHPPAPPPERPRGNIPSPPANTRRSRSPTATARATPARSDGSRASQQPARPPIPAGQHPARRPHLRPRRPARSNSPHAGQHPPARPPPPPPRRRPGRSSRPRAGQHPGPVNPRGRRRARNNSPCRPTSGGLRPAPPRRVRCRSESEAAGGARVLPGVPGVAGAGAAGSRGATARGHDPAANCALIGAPGPAGRPPGRRSDRCSRVR